MNHNRPEGKIFLKNITGDDGKSYLYEDAVRFGWMTPRKVVGNQIGTNLFTDQGRQLISYMFGGGGAYNLASLAVTNFSVGTGVSTTKVTDTSLQNLVSFSGGARKAINGVDYPDPFVARVEVTVGLADCNGYLLTEFGLYSGSDALYARWLDVGINKTASFAPTFIWRCRF